MAMPIAVKDGICFAFPDVLGTPVGPAMVPMPYPNIAKLSDAQDFAATVKAGGKEVIVENSQIPNSTGGEPGTGGPFQNKECKFTAFSGTVTANGKKVVRQFDATSQNHGNAVGMVMSGVASVVVGG